MSLWLARAPAALNPEDPGHRASRGNGHRRGHRERGRLQGKRFCYVA
jgi:hypothetical protein